MIGALGACFGRVVTMDSPKAREPGTFSWQATLWHELAHVVTLQLSNQRVPRWLTEGISVYEEGKARQEWGREMEVPFAMALQRKETLQAEGSERRLHQARNDRARVLPGVAARRSHRHDLRAGRAAAAARGLRRGSRRGGGARQGTGRVHRQAAGQLRRGDRQALRGAAQRAADCRRATVRRRAARRREEPRRSESRGRPPIRTASRRSWRSGAPLPKPATRPRSRRSNAPRRWCRSPPAKAVRTP